MFAQGAVTKLVLAAQLSGNYCLWLAKFAKENSKLPKNQQPSKIGEV